MRALQEERGNITKKSIRCDLDRKESLFTMATKTHHKYTGRGDCPPGCRKRHFREHGFGIFTNGSIKAAGMAALIFLTVSHSASAVPNNGPSSYASTIGTEPFESKQQASGFMSSILPSLWSQQDDVDIESKFLITSIVNNRLLQKYHSGHDEHVGDDTNESDHDHDHEQVEHLHAEEEADDHGGHIPDDHDGHIHGANEGDEAEFHAHDTKTTSNESKDNGEPWGAVIGAALLVNVATFSGVLILALPAMYRGLLKYRNIPVESSPAAHGSGRFFDIIIPGFACGALIATAVFLVLPESLKYISGEGSDSHTDHSDHDRRSLEADVHASEGTVAAKFGCSVLGGFLLPFVLAIIFHHSDLSEDEAIQTPRDNVLAVVDEEEDCETCNDKHSLGTGVEITARVDDPQDSKSSSLIIQKIEDVDPQDRCKCEVCEEEGVTDENEQEAIITKSFVNRRLCASILLGDSFHNFADGFFIAAAFRSCSIGVAISIVLVTLFHEIAQELADFIVLTKYGGLSAGRALIFNFLSGLSVCLGGVIFLAAKPSDVATGVILAMAGGVYINIAACETAPRMERAMQVRGDRILMLFSIILGTIPLGLILLDHRHCD